MCPLVDRRGVFVSYARTDGEQDAQVLARRIEAEGLEVWMDRGEMRGGRDWWQQITDAIDRAGFLVLVVTPGAMARQTTRREWRYARERGVCVFPVMASPDLDFAAMPKWMAAQHFYSFPAEWETFLNYLKSPCTRDRVPFMAPPLPRGYVARRHEMDRVKGQLLDHRGDAVAITASLQGSGGFGKTTLAAALCHDDDVQAAFDGGVLWATLGTDSDRVWRELTRLHRALTGEPSSAMDAHDATRDVRERLRDKRALLVVDDVWDVADLHWFLDVGPQVAHVVTTRQFAVAREGARSLDTWVRIQEMKEGEAVDMLADDLESAPNDLAPLRALVKRLGQWPLLVRLASGALDARLARGASIDRALRYINELLDRHGLVAFDADDSDQRNDAAASSVAASLELLDRDDAARWAELTVFPQQVAVPLRTLEQLWQLDRLDTEELATRLDDLALIHLDLAKDTVTVHEVLLEVVRDRISDAAAINRRLVSQWDLESLPADDDYAWKWVGHHLISADQAARLRDLLLDPVWIDTKIRNADAHEVILDYERLPDDQELRLLGDAIRSSAHVIDRDPDQLASQLYGRLSPDMGTGIAQMLADVATAAVQPWLRPETRSLLPPGSGLQRTLHGMPTRSSAWL